MPGENGEANRPQLQFPPTEGQWQPVAAKVATPKFYLGHDLHIIWDGQSRFVSVQVQLTARNQCL